ncbi:MAG: bifunctional nuclease family protein [Planctomycetota bacterium]
MNDLVPVEISRLVLQQKGEPQYVHLRVLDSERSFPIVIGFHEAAEIYRKLANEAFERPMTHDLIGRILDATNRSLRRVIINAITEGTFHAMLDLTLEPGFDDEDDNPFIDCRPSDAIALAAQFQTPIFVKREVLDAVAPEG